LAVSTIVGLISVPVQSGTTLPPVLEPSAPIAFSLALVTGNPPMISSLLLPSAGRSDAHAPIPAATATNEIARTNDLCSHAPHSRSEYPIIRSFLLC
jgi:hypothetical protein